ncbi:GATA transcription factor 1-like [Salvia miltiorrhiza]|uniref:GATA transcription factor 1-like n=1 Tax=Salvia miltiorrhiza TaxID=226208 RepID=UPI0025ACC0B6|nr:GATA transcription factor 1-like [Salvia miltiorrhiza]
MEILDRVGACFTVDEDDLLNFNLEGEGEEKDLTIFKGASASSSSLETPNPAAAAAAAFGRGALSGPYHEFVEEEELEWLSNKDAFPSVETCFGILADNPELVMNHQSPVSVLENSSSSSHSNSNSNGGSIASCCNSLKVPTNYPVRARSKRRRRRGGYGDLPSQQSLWLNPVSVKSKKEVSFTLPPLPTITSSGAGMGRRCLHCHAEKTPQWRAGPMGPKTLCNACGVRYKSGRLLPEYRPASSPTFSSVLHSNSHRKVVEMRKQKQGPEGEGMPVNVSCGYRLG